MLDGLRPWPGQDKLVGRRTPGPEEPQIDPMDRRQTRAGWGHPNEHRPSRADPRESVPLIRITVCSRCLSDSWSMRAGIALCDGCGVRIQMLADGSGPVILNQGQPSPETLLPPLPAASEIGDTILELVEEEIDAND